MSKKNNEKQDKIAEVLGSEMLSDAILESPIFKLMQRNIIKQTYLGGVVMAAIIVGMWNLINALEIDPVVSGSASLLVGLILFFVQIRGLFTKPKLPKKKGSFPCPECGVKISFKGYTDKIKCNACGYEVKKQI